MPDTTQIDAFHAQAQVVSAKLGPLEEQLKEIKDAVASINWLGQRAMEKITQNESIPLLDRLTVFFNAPEEFKKHLENRPCGKCKAMQSAIDYAVEGHERHDIITLEDMARAAWTDVESNPEAVVWWAKEEGYLAKAFLEEMLQRSLLTFNCY